MKKKLLFSIFIIICLFNSVFLKSINAEENIYYDENINEQFKNIEAPNLLLGNTNSGEILYGKSIDEKVYPASLTKLMTAILVLENCELDEIATVSENAVRSVPSGYVNANLQVGEELTIEDLLYVMLIPSANDAANVLAEYVGGNTESFATMMNTKAKELGCTGSNFTNPSGLHEEEHFSTARDMFIIANEAIKNDIIRKIIQTTRYTLPQTNKYSKDARIFTSTNYLILPSLSKFYTEECIGGKTGYTEHAKNCVIEFFKKGDMELTVIVMGATANVKGQKFLDAKEMFEYLSNNYNIKEIAKKGEICKTIEIKNATKQTKELNLLYKESLSVLMKNNSIRYEENIEYLKEKAPIKKGETVGIIKYNYEGKEYKLELIAENNVEKSKMLIILIVLIIIIFILYLLKKSKKNIGNHGKNINI